MTHARTFLTLILLAVGTMDRFRVLEFWKLKFWWENKISKGHSLCKQSLHDLQFMKKGSSSPNLSKLAISCQFMKNKILVQNCLHNEWTLKPFMQSIFFLFFDIIKTQEDRAQFNSIDSLIWTYLVSTFSHSDTKLNFMIRFV